jgi:hypothetical protein
VEGEPPYSPLRRLPDGSWISADGRWLWRGGTWVSLPAVAWPPALFWFTAAPSWFSTLLIIGLVGLIPVVGVMNLYGYTLVTSRNLRAGYRVLPPANFSFILAGAPAAVLSLAWSLITIVLFSLFAVGVGLVTYHQTHDWAWTVALAFASGFTIATLFSTLFRVLFVPALELSGRDGWAIFRANLNRQVREHWRATWYGNGVLLLWSAVYLAIALVAGFVPFGSIFGSIAGLGLMAPLLAVALARFDDPPAGFTQAWANVLAAAVAGFSLLAMAVVWAVGLSVASYVSAHPEEVACFFDLTCNAAYSGELETITNVQRDQKDPGLVIVHVKFINHSRSGAAIDPGEYQLRTFDGRLVSPSSECPAPGSAMVAAGGRLEQRVCFRLPDPQSAFDLRVPWTGWDYRTGVTPVPSPSP